MLPERQTACPSTKDNTIADALAVSSVLSEGMRLVGGGALGPSAQHEKRERAGLQGSRSTLATGCSKAWPYAHGRVGESQAGVRAYLGTQLVSRARQLAPSVYLEVSRKAGSS